jgi:hypothetical protein
MGACNASSVPDQHVGCPDDTALGFENCYSWIVIQLNKRKALKQSIHMSPETGKSFSASLFYITSKQANAGRAFIPKKRSSYVLGKEGRPSSCLETNILWVMQEFCLVRVIAGIDEKQVL